MKTWEKLRKKNVYLRNTNLDDFLIKFFYLKLKLIKLGLL